MAIGGIANAGSLFRMVSFFAFSAPFAFQGLDVGSALLFDFFSR
jgi:hypothetical protein